MLTPVSGFISSGVPQASKVSEAKLLQSNSTQASDALAQHKASRF
ncbi:unnamed protein product [Larinioides sclopetarius]|uniref:Uncharacterized protein n=1 Tax=Larinioides sclopetarius TaxID=280406 RepID=A0AAV2ARA4_9ARAC